MASDAIENKEDLQAKRRFDDGDEDTLLSNNDRPHFDSQDENEALHRQQAVAKHKQRIFGQTASAVKSALIILLAPLYWRGLMLACGFEFSSAWPAAFGEIWLADLLTGANDTPFGGIFLLAVLLAPVFWLAARSSFMWFRYRFLRDLEWQLRSAEAESNEPQKLAYGYMGVFRMYARTKRRAIFTLLAAIAWCVFAVTGSVSILFVETVGDDGAWRLVFAATSAVIFAQSLLLGYIAYDISRRYIPGKMLVVKTMVMAIRVGTSQTDYSVARKQAEKFQEKVLDEKPWWFYSYRKAPK